MRVTKRDWCEISGIIFLLLILLANHTVISAAQNPDQNREPYPSGSWALGIVVPENAQFSDGGLLSWQNASSITAVIRLANITYTDAPTLAVVSVMARDGLILQIAAGIYPNLANWRTYGWLVRGFLTNSKTYEWVLNASKPEMAVYAWVSLSIYLSSSRWRYRVEDLGKREVVDGEFPFDVAPSPKVGDQEVFALESYSTRNLVFDHMGELLLSSLSINGRNVSKGWYPYGSWDPSHNPLFVVGGLQPPSFISLQQSGNAALVWNYQQWTVPQRRQSYDPALIAVIVAPILLAVGFIAISQSRKKVR